MSATNPPQRAIKLFSKGLEFHQLNALDDAARCYQNALEMHGSFFDAQHLLGVIAAQQEQFELAVALITKALNIRADEGAFSNRGLALHQLGQYQAALKDFDSAISFNPNNPQSHYNRGNALQEIKQYEAALRSYDQAIALDPSNAEIYNNRGNTLQEIKQYEAALRSYDQAIALDPSNANAHYNQGNALQEIKQYEAALRSYDQAIALNPSNAEAFNGRGGCLEKQRKYQAAATQYLNAIQLNPTYEIALFNLANSLQTLGKPKSALEYYLRVLEQNKNNIEAHINCANTLRTLRQYDQALVHYQRALTLDPHAKFLRGMALHLKMMMCDWSNFDDDIALLAQAIECGQVASEPFPILSIYNSLQHQLDLSSAYQADKFKGLQPIPWAAKYPKKERIRIAYYSTDFREHPVSLLLAELFEKHNRSQFEVFAFSLGENTNDPMRQRLKKAFDHFIDVQDLSDTDIVALSRKHEIDIAIDLGGYTAGSRSEIFQLRVAPIQISYIGYLGTMGTPCIDYLIADKVLIPAQLSPFYTENIAYLPSYQANVSTREIASRSFIRSEYGIPENHFVFCCFNNNYKITPPVFKSWMHILKEVQNSVLFLYAENQWVQSNLEKSALGHGVAKERLIFGQRLSTPEYLARYRIADLFLDTFPYNAGTTASDALWMGVPVLTLAGETFSSRMAASLLTAIDMPELITNTPAQFENRAIEIAKNRGLLSGLKSKLEDNKENTRLFDTPKFIQSLESCYLAMYERGLNDLDPTDLG